MEASAMLALALPIGLGLAAIGSGIGFSRAISAAMEAIGRQPEASGKIQTAMIFQARSGILRKILNGLTRSLTWVRSMKLQLFMKHILAWPRKKKALVAMLNL